MTDFQTHDSPPNDQIPADDWRFSIAPMMEWSDRHCRYFWRLLSKRARLYTEMVTTGALIHGDRQRFLDFSPEEHPIALQLGGSQPADLATCAKLAEEWGYDEVNLNCGCPSDRVQENRIGACLMDSPKLVADCVDAMQQACDISVTVKHRIGIDDLDSEEHLIDFIGTVADAGCTTFIVHARKAWLSGLSPKQNREIPPLDYERVYRMKQIFPQLTIAINGGIKTCDETLEQLEHVDGVMIGREAYHNPYMLSDIDEKVYGESRIPPTRDDILEQMITYADKMVGSGLRLHYISRHILGLYLGQPGARVFRRYISEHAPRADADAKVLYNARLAMESAIPAESHRPQ